MGTRSLTHIIDNQWGEERLIATIYRQMDGYLDGHGLEVASFLAKREVVNGISSDPTEVFNGTGCLAASLVAYLKARVRGDLDGVDLEIAAGNIYLEEPGIEDLGEEYVYSITVNPDLSVTFRAKSLHTPFDGGDQNEFAGTPQTFVDMITTKEDE
jgi:hypothetical protein